MNEHDSTGIMSNPNETNFSELCLKAKLLDGGWLQIITYGYVVPPIIFVTLVTNFFVCIVLLKKKMRNQTSIILVALAISDSLTGLLPLPFFIYFYTTGNYKYYLPYVPYGICSTYVAFKELLPTISHTCSIWLTIALALQRYFFVRRPSIAKTMKIGKTVKIIVFVFVMSVAIHVCRFAEYSYVPAHRNFYLRDNSSSSSSYIINNSFEDKNQLACCRISLGFFERYKNIYFYIYYLLFRAVFIHIVPCTILVIMNYILIREMRKARDRRVKLLKTKMINNRAASNPCEGHASTLMLVVVVGCFLLVELPLAVLFLLLIAKEYFKISILSHGMQVNASVLLNTFIIFSYPINFFIYCVMSKSFRQCFMDLFRFRSRDLRPITEKNSGRPQFLAVKGLKVNVMEVPEAVKDIQVH